MLQAIGIIIASVSVLLMTFVVLVSAHNITKDISSAWNIIASQNVTASQNATNIHNSTNTTETKLSQSLTLKGLSPQGGSTVAIGCTYFLQHCQVFSCHNHLIKHCTCRNNGSLEICDKEALISFVCQVIYSNDTVTFCELSFTQLVVLDLQFLLSSCIHCSYNRCCKIWQ